MGSKNVFPWKYNDPITDLSKMKVDASLRQKKKNSR